MRLTSKEVWEIASRINVRYCGYDRYSVSGYNIMSHQPRDPRYKIEVQCDSLRETYAALQAMEMVLDTFHSHLRMNNNQYTYPW